MQSPLFLVFLDCVWQLLQQFPSSFQFSEIYLTTLWDSIGLGLFRNFIFSGVCEERQEMSAQRQSSRNSTSSTESSSAVTARLMSVWNWEVQFEEEDIAMFANPLYAARQLRTVYRNSSAAGSTEGLARSLPLELLSPTRPQASARGTRSLSRKPLPVTPIDPAYDVLWPAFGAHRIHLWEHCYLRWLTPVMIDGGGTPAEYISQCHALEGMNRMQQSILNLLEMKGRDTSVGTEPKGDYSDSAARDKLEQRVQAIGLITTDRLSSSYPFAPSRPANHTTLFIAQIPERMVSGSEDTLSMDELSVIDSVDD